MVRGGLVDREERMRGIAMIVPRGGASVVIECDSVFASVDGGRCVYGFGIGFMVRWMEWMEWTKNGDAGQWC